MAGLGSILKSITGNKSTSETKQPESLRTYTIKQSKGYKGFERLDTSSHYDAIQKDIKKLVVSDPKNEEYPYKAQISDSDIVFKEIMVDGLISLQIYVDGLHIGTLFDDDMNRKYMLAMKQGKVDAVHVEIKPEKHITSDGELYEFKTTMFGHIEG